MFCGHGSILGENAYIKQAHGLQLLPSCIFPIVHMQKKTKCNISMSSWQKYLHVHEHGNGLKHSGEIPVSTGFNNWATCCLKLGNAVAKVSACWITFTIFCLPQQTSSQQGTHCMQGADFIRDHLFTFRPAKALPFLNRPLTQPGHMLRDNSASVSAFIYSCIFSKQKERLPNNLRQK